ncbi:hypothetical protein C0Q70_01724 [Pomacea canaliculata]|uniref:Uncharacterized protein n=2 Tax=Pomacea canaliculata TaxID=400727 RepID=A0A2T7Q096_POMCA|nr:hypothetical protein C0Q70_01724 [Pomacea canaliculata]
MALALYKEENVLPFHKRQREFNFLGQTLRIQQDWGKLGVAAVVWDSAVVLCDYLVKHQEIVFGKRVLELGAGTGLVGMVAALAGGDVTVTERFEVLPHLEAVIADNFNSGNYLITVEELDWTRDNIYSFPDFDVILGADIIYVEETFPDLLRLFFISLQ